MASSSRVSAEKRPKERRRLHLRDLRNDPNAPLESVGAELRAGRLKAGEDLDTVCAKLKIRKDILQALEDSDYSNQPSKVYSIGFVRAYARYLGLNADNLVKRFKSEISGRSMDKAPNLNFPRHDDDRSIPNASFFLMMGLVGAGIYGFWYMSRPQITDGAPVVISEAEADKAAEAATPEPVAAPALGLPADPGLLAVQMAGQVPAAPKVYGATDGVARVQLRATEDAYVRVRMVNEDGPVVLFEQTLAVGEVYRVPDRPGLSLRTGNAGGLELEIDGKLLGKLGSKGSVANNISLDPDKLVARISERNAPRRDPRDEPATTIAPPPVVLPSAEPVAPAEPVQPNPGPAAQGGSQARPNG